MTAGSPLVWVLVLAAAAVLLGLMVLHANRIEGRTVEVARRLLPGHVVEATAGGHRFTGEVGGVEITLRLYQVHGESEGAGPWTEVVLPGAEAVLLELRPQNPLQSHLVERGLASDASAGDPEFDRQFVVEMAPASLAPAVFDADLRRLLLALRPVRVLPREGGGLRLVRRRWEPERFAALIEAGALLARRLREAVGADADQAARSGPPHERERERERAALVKVRSARASWTVRNVVIIVVGMLAILVLGLLLR